MVSLLRLQCTDAAHAFRNPFISVMYVCVGAPSSGAIGHSGNVDKIVSVEVVICFVSVLRYAQSSCRYLVTTVNDVIADRNVVTKIINNSTGLQRIELNGFAKRHLQTGYYPFVYGWCLGLC